MAALGTGGMSGTQGTSGTLRTSGTLGTSGTTEIFFGLRTQTKHQVLSKEASSVLVNNSMKIYCTWYRVGLLYWWHHSQHHGHETFNKYWSCTGHDTHTIFLKKFLYFPDRTHSCNGIWFLSQFFKSKTDSSFLTNLLIMYKMTYQYVLYFEGFSQIIFFLDVCDSIYPWTYHGEQSSGVTGKWIFKWKNLTLGWLSLLLLLIRQKRS